MLHYTNLLSFTYLRRIGRIIGGRLRVSGARMGRLATVPRHADDSEHYRSGPCVYLVCKAYVRHTRIRFVFGTQAGKLLSCWLMRWSVCLSDPVDGNG